MAGVTLTIGEDAGGAVGFALARAVADEAELLLLAVDPARQGSGVGQRAARRLHRKRPRRRRQPAPP